MKTAVEYADAMNTLGLVRVGADPDLLREYIREIQNDAVGDPLSEIPNANWERTKLLAQCATQIYCAGLYSNEHGQIKKCVADARDILSAVEGTKI